MKSAETTRYEFLFIFLLCLFTTIMIFTLMDLNSINPDETIYLFMGKSILEGRYGEPGICTYDFTHRPPLVPSMVSYEELESDARYERVKQIYNNGQVVLIIYKLEAEA